MCQEGDSRAVPLLAFSWAPLAHIHSSTKLPAPLRGDHKSPGEGDPAASDGPDDELLLFLVPPRHGAWPTPRRRDRGGARPCSPALVLRRELFHLRGVDACQAHRSPSPG